MTTEMSVRRYLDRIGYSGMLAPRHDVLQQLHRRHMLSVPFENLDIHLGKPIELDQKSFYRKIVDDRRGGYCYELNGCFAWLLKKLGFRVSMLSAKVASNQGRFSPEFDHMALLVRLKERWLADVGFGDSFTEPKRIDNDKSQRDGRVFYRIAPVKGRMMVSRKGQIKDSWKPQYSFTLRPRKLADFASRNRYQQTSSHSHFTQQRIISKLTWAGRLTLTDKKLISTQNGKRSEKFVRGQAGFDRFLANYFALSLVKNWSGRDAIDLQGER